MRAHHSLSLLGIESVGEDPVRGPRGAKGRDGRTLEDLGARCRKDRDPRPPLLPAIQCTERVLFGPPQVRSLEIDVTPGTVPAVAPSKGCVRRPVPEGPHLRPAAATPRVCQRQRSVWKPTASRPGPQPAEDAQTTRNARHAYQSATATRRVRKLAPVRVAPLAEVLRILSLF